MLLLINHPISIGNIQQRVECDSIRILIDVKKLLSTVVETLHATSQREIILVNALFSAYEGW